MRHLDRCLLPSPWRALGRLVVGLLATAFADGAVAHAVAEGDKGYLQEITDVHLIPFVDLGAKHMVII